MNITPSATSQIRPAQTTLTKRVVAESSLRFGKGIQAGAIESTLAKASKPFFGWPEAMGKFLDNRIPKAVKGFFGQGYFQRLFSMDFQEVPFLPKIGHFGAEIPLGVMLVLAYGFMVGGRVQHALKRASNGDKREVRDIIFRDIPTITILIMGFPILLRVLTRGLIEPIRGIQMMNTQSLFKYSELENMYRVLDSNRLVSLLKNKQNHKGLIQAIDKVMGNRSLSGVSRGLLNRFKRRIEEGIKLVKTSNNPKQLEDIAKQAFGFLKRLDADRAKYLKSLGAGNTTASKGLLGKLTSWFSQTLPPFNEMFSRYAKNSRVWGDAAAFAISIGVLGYGITWFNQWYTEREFQKLQARQKIQPTSSNPFPSAGGKLIFTGTQHPMNLAAPNPSR